MINPGKYDKMIVFYKQKVDNTGSRAPIGRWIRDRAKRARVWQVSTLEKKDQIQGLKEDQELFCAELRYDKKISNDMVWVYKGKTINIKEQFPKSSDEEMLIKGFTMKGLDLAGK